MKIICLEKESLRKGWINSMDFNGKDFINGVKILAVLLLVGFAIWQTKKPICLVVLPFLKFDEDEK